MNDKEQISKETGDMDTLDAIHTRRSIRRYLGEPVGEELVQKLLAAAMQAPSARNQQPWQFVVIDQRGAGRDSGFDVIKPTRTSPKRRLVALGHRWRTPR